MKLTTVLGSVNNNPDYYNFIPKQIRFWSHFGISFIAVFVGDHIPECLMQYSNNIILWNKNLDLNTAYVGQNIRMYYSALVDLPDDEYIMITDMDMLPTSAEYYTTGLEEYTKQDFIYYRNVDGNQIYMCYNAGHPSVWGQCFGIQSSEDIERKLYENYQTAYNGIPGSNGWYIDQEIMYRALIHYPFLKILNRPLKRLETYVYANRLQNGETEFVSSYDDVHFHRSFSKNESLILNAEMQLKIMPANS